MSQGTAFAFQGRLFDAGAPANGKYDLRLNLYDGITGGALVAGPVTNSAVVVSNGLFSTVIDFGAGIFTGPRRFLEVGARSNTVAVGFTVITPRQELLPFPYGVTAENVSGAIPASQLTGTLPTYALAGTYGNTVNFNNPGNSFSGSGSGLTGVVTGLNGLTQGIGLVPGANVTLATNGNILTISATGAGIWSMNGTSAYYGSGNVGIGTASPGYTLEVNGQAHRTDNSATWTTTSDRRVKEDIRELAGSLETLERIRPVRFRFSHAYERTHPGCNDREAFGIVAQEYKEVFPDYVTRDPEGFLGVDISPLIVHNTAAIRELDALISEKSSRIATLEKANSELEFALNEQSKRTESLRVQLTQLQEAVHRLQGLEGASARGN
jgi:hypothetical protein